ncbi:MAG: ankyrin repeat domain-containing protein [Chitinophagaceae bacterium]
MAQLPIPGMKQPIVLQTDAYAPWNGGRGTDIWAMICACITGDLNTIKALVAKDPQLVHCSFEYLTPIRFAARENHLPVVEYLIENGANAVFDFSDSLTTIANDRGYTELALFLTIRLEQLHHIRPEGDQLASLIKSFDKQAVKDFILKDRSLIHAADARGNQPIHWSVLTRQMDLTEWLLEYGAGINAVRPDGARPLDLTNGDYYYRSWYRDLPPTGLQKADVLAGYLIGKGADYDISVAAKMGHYERVKELLESDPAVANRLPLHVGYYSGLPLRNASAGGFIEIVRLLLEYGANPNEREPGIAPWGAALHSAISRKHWNIVRLLLENGANANGHAESSGNCLWMAKYVGAPQEIIDLLVAHGAKLSLELICYDGDTATLSKLLEEDPNLIFTDEEHRDLLNHRPLVELVLKYQPDVLKQFSIRSMNDPEQARWLIENGLDPNNGDWLGVKPLHRAASDGNIEMANVYLEAGADINALDTDIFSTPLGWAARSGKKEMMEWLLNKGADIHLPLDKKWAQPAEWAKRRGHIDIIQLLKSE